MGGESGWLPHPTPENKAAPKTFSEVQPCSDQREKDRQGREASLRRIRRPEVLNSWPSKSKSAPRIAYKGSTAGLTNVAKPAHTASLAGCDSLAAPTIKAIHGPPYAEQLDLHGRWSELAQAPVQTREVVVQPPKVRTDPVWPCQIEGKSMSIHHPSSCAAQSKPCFWAETPRP